MNDRVITIRKPGDIAVVYDQQEFESLGPGWTIIHQAQKGTMSVWIAYRPHGQGGRDGHLSAH
jgi:hypothetical protein